MSVSSVLLFGLWNCLTRKKDIHVSPFLAQEGVFYHFFFLGNFSRFQEAAVKTSWFFSGRDLAQYVFEYHKKFYEHLIMCNGYHKDIVRRPQNLENSSS